MSDDFKFLWLKDVLKGTRIAPEHFSYAKGFLLRAFDEQDMYDRLDRLRQTEPHIFLTRPPRRDEHGADLMAAMRESGVTHAAHSVLKSILRHGTNKESMLETLATLRRTQPTWFKRAG